MAFVGCKNAESVGSQTHMASTTRFNLSQLFVALTLCGIGSYLIAHVSLATIVFFSIALVCTVFHLFVVTLADRFHKFLTHRRRQSIKSLGPLVVSPSIDCVIATDDEIAVSQMQTVKFLRLPVDDADVRRLCDYGDLKWLILDNSDVSDEGLDYLHGLTRLRRVYVRKTRVTTSGVKRLIAALPNVDVLY